MNILLVLVDVGNGLSVTGNAWGDLSVSFVVGLVCSTIPMVVAFYFANKKYFKPNRKLEKAGVEDVFDNQSDAVKNGLIEEIKKSGTLRVLAVRGASFSNMEHPDGIAKAILPNKNIEQLYLISGTANTYIETRAKELKNKGGNPLTSNEVNTSINRFKEARNTNEHINFRFHNETGRFRLIILDDYLYLSFQEDGKYGQESSMFKINKISPLYKTYSTFFDELWEKPEIRGNEIS
jgi:hypothetical protein